MRGCLWAQSRAGVRHTHLGVRQPVRGRRRLDPLETVRWTLSRGRGPDDLYGWRQLPQIHLRMARSKQSVAGMDAVRQGQTDPAREQFLLARPARGRSRYRSATSRAPRRSTGSSNLRCAESGCSSISASTTGMPSGRRHFRPRCASGFLAATGHGTDCARAGSLRPRGIDAEGTVFLDRPHGCKLRSSASRHAVEVPHCRSPLPA